MQIFGFHVIFETHLFVQKKYFVFIFWLDKTCLCDIVGERRFSNDAMHWSDLIQLKCQVTFIWPYFDLLKGRSRAATHPKFYLLFWNPWNYFFQIIAAIVSNNFLAVKDAFLNKSMKIITYLVMFLKYIGRI